MLKTEVGKLAYVHKMSVQIEILEKSIILLCSILSLDISITF